MKYLKMLGLAAVAGMAMTASTAGSASSTTLEVDGVTQNQSVAITANLQGGSEAVLARTDGSLANKCKVSHAEGATTSPYTGTQVTGPLSNLSFEECEDSVTVHDPGELFVQHISGTTDGTVFSENAEVTVFVFDSFYVTCKTGNGTDIGRLTGKASGNAILDINAVLNCGFLLPSATWKGTYVTNALGVSA